MFRLENIKSKPVYTVVSRENETGSWRKPVIASIHAAFPLLQYISLYDISVSKNVHFGSMTNKHVTVYT